MQKYSILLVDDDPVITAGTGGDLAEKGYKVTTASSGEEAIELLKKSFFDLVITDLVMGSMDGISVLKEAKEINPELPVIILTGFGDMVSAIEAVRLNADDYLLKPCESEQMHFRVSRCLEKLALKRKVKLYEKILPVCCVCKKIQDDSRKEHEDGQWMSVEEYLYTKAKVDITSAYCPECFEKAMKEAASEI